MPRLPTLKDRELLAALRVLGFEEHRQHGTSHLIMKHKDGRRMVIALRNGRDIPRGTLGGMLREARISNDELLAALASS